MDFPCGGCFSGNTFPKRGEERLRSCKLSTPSQTLIFNPEASAASQLVQLEELVLEYERVARTTYPREILLSTLLRCKPSPLEEYSYLQMTETTSYSDVKEYILLYERDARNWSPSQMLRLQDGGSSGSGNRALGTVNNPPSDGGGQQDMEVNAVQEQVKGHWRGKGKSKGKGKYRKVEGKGHGWRYFGRGRGRARQAMPRVPSFASLQWHVAVSHCRV